MREFLLDNIRKVRNDILVLACNVKIADESDVKAMSETMHPSMTIYEIPDAENYKSPEYIIYEELVNTAKELETKYDNFDETLSKLAYTKDELIGDTACGYIEEYHNLYSKFLKYESIVSKNLNKFVTQMKEIKDQLFINESIIRRMYHFLSSIEFIDSKYCEGMKEWLCQFAVAFRNGQYTSDTTEVLIPLLTDSIYRLSKIQEILLAIGYNTDIRGSSPEYIKMVNSALASSIEVEQKNYDLEHSMYSFVKLEKYLDSSDESSIECSPVKLYPCVHELHVVDPKCGYKKIGDEIDISPCAHSECEICSINN